MLRTLSDEKIDSVLNALMLDLISMLLIGCQKKIKCDTLEFKY